MLYLTELTKTEASCKGNCKNLQRFSSICIFPNTHEWKLFSGDETLITQQASVFASALRWEGCGLSSQWLCTFPCNQEQSGGPNQLWLSGYDAERWLASSAYNIPREANGSCWSVENYCVCFITSLKRYRDMYLLLCLMWRRHAARLALAHLLRR